MFDEAKRIVVTGGAGFVGSFVCDRLLAEGAYVICLDNLQTGSMDNIEHLMADPRFRFMALDVELPLTSICRVDQIYNLACPASPVQYQMDPIRTMRTNVLGAINVLELARRSGARILQASTSEIYGDPDVHPQHEDYLGAVQSFGPRACYDEGKRAAESLFFDHARMFGIDIRIARIFNTYGPGMAESDGRVVSNFVTQALNGEPITIYGDGTRTRSFCFVSEMVDGLIRLMNSGKHMNRPCNLGNPEETTIGELAELILKFTGSQSRIEYKESPQDDPTRRCPDISLAQRELDWSPIVSLSEGIEPTVRYFEALKKRTEARVAGSNRLETAIRPYAENLPGFATVSTFGNAGILRDQKTRTRGNFKANGIRDIVKE